MTSSNLKKPKSGLHLIFGGVNPYLSWGIVLLSPSIIWIHMVYAQQRLQMCTADALALLSGSFFPLRVVLIPVFLLYMQQLLRNDFTTVYVIRSKDRRSIWNMQCAKLLICSLLCAAFIGLCSLWSAQSLFGEVMNWDRIQSNYCFNTGSVNTTLTFSQFLPAFFVSLWLQLFGSGLLFLLLMWLARHTLIPWLSIMVLVAWSTWVSTWPASIRPLFFDWMQVTFFEWQRQVVPRNFVIAFLLILALYIVGWLLSRGKEFYE